jgi:hypothetical protein
MQCRQLCRRGRDLLGGPLAARINLYFTFAFYNFFKKFMTTACLECGVSAYDNRVSILQCRAQAGVPRDRAALPSKDGMRRCWLAVMVAGTCLGPAAGAGASSVGTVRELADAWPSERQLLLRSPWAAALGWNSTMSMCGTTQRWNQSTADAATYDDFKKACYCSRTDVLKL